MLLQSLKLKNIRSYQDQSINFPENSTLLSGDIGSGKSTLLLAIEFALFGISKPDLTGETLLRKGETSASVQLHFTLNNQKIQIERNLKKNKLGIQQQAGSITINNIRKDLTPVELKTEIINLLNYPEDLITKNKNYIFRYTLYCPQEEMKLILQETPDQRLDILRKIFQLDKYKTIRENIWYYLKQLRIKTTVLKTRLEPLEKKKTELTNLRQQQTALTKEFNLLLPKLTNLQSQIKNKKDELEQLEKNNQLHQQLKNKLENNLNLQKEKQAQQAQLQKQQQTLQEKLSHINITENKQTLNQQLLNLQQQQQEFLEEKSQLTTKISHCQDQVKTAQQEISHLQQQLENAPQKQAQLQTLTKALQQKPKLQQNKDQLEQQLDQLKQQLHQHQLIQQQTQEIKNQIANLQNCPTCLQEVPEHYKLKVLKNQEEKAKIAKAEIEKLQQQKSELQQQFLLHTQQLESLQVKENLHTKLKTELENLHEKQQQQTEKQAHLKQLIIENNGLLKQLEKLNPDKINDLNQKIEQQQKLLQQLTQKQELQQQLQQLQDNLTNFQSDLAILNHHHQQLQQQLTTTPHLQEKITKIKNDLNQHSEQEKIYLTNRTRIQTKQEHLQQQLETLLKEIDQLNQAKIHLKRITEHHRWLEEFFIKLTYTIEKQVLTRIHHLFNHLFQEWFEILIEDQNFQARLDDSFTPIIEQNGYEIFFNNLSGGERTAASLSYRLALNKVINDIIHQINTKDLLILDEPTDGFSSEQLDKIRDVLEKLNLKQTIIVSHESKIESFVNHVIRITKQEGTSHLI